MDPIVKEMLETLHVTDLKIDEEMHKLPPCELLGHSTGGDFHDANSPASFWVIAPCGAERFACARWVAYGSMTVSTDCYLCGSKHLNSDYTYIPINMKEDS